jgi:L-alanine-DL-glutamate epimerase-like enolase superfamily enzyme
MYLKTIAPIAVRLPLAKPIKMAGVSMSATENLLVRIEDDAGNVGWGEACSAPTMTGETAAGMVAAVRYLAPQLEGTSVEDIGELVARLERLMYGNPGAKSAIEIAAYDLLGQRLDLPLYELLGGKKRDSTPVLWMLAAADLELDRPEARRKRDEGFQSFKVKVAVKGGREGVARDLERAQSIRQAIGGGVQISADANQGYSREDALGFVQGADESVLDFFEQPVAGHDLEGMQAIARASRVPIGADEGIHSLADIERHAAAGAAQGVSLKTIKLGGVAGVASAAQQADALGMKINLAGKIADSSIASAAIAHLAVALPQIDWGVSVTNQYLAQDLTRDPLLVKAGRITPTSAAGLGIRVDEGQVSRFAYTLAL